MTDQTPIAAIAEYISRLNQRIEMLERIVLSQEKSITMLTDVVETLSRQKSSIQLSSNKMQL